MPIEAHAFVFVAGDWKHCTSIDLLCGNVELSNKKLLCCAFLKLLDMVLTAEAESIMLCFSSN